jgi:hypothetical protein
LHGLKLSGGRQARQGSVPSPQLSRWRAGRHPLSSFS